MAKVTTNENSDTVVTDRYGTPVPMGWNWGAFFLSRYWCRSHSLNIQSFNDAGLDFNSFHPRVFSLVIKLGKYGSWMAWESGNWESAEHFIRVQRRWELYSFIYVVLFIAFIVMLIFLLRYN